MQDNKNKLKLIIGFGVTAVALWLVFRKMDFAGVAEIIASASPMLLAGSLLCLGIGYSFRIARWWLMMRFINPSLGYGAVAGPFLSSIALNNVLPFRAGDVARAFGFRAQLGANPSQVLGTLLLERLLDLLSLLVIFFLGLRGINVTGPLRVLHGTATLLTAAAAAAFLFTIFAPGPIRKLIGFLLELPALRGSAIAAKFLAVVDHVFSALSVLRSPGTGLLLICFTFLAWLFEGGMYAVLAYAVHMDQLAPAAFFALAVGTLATLVPSSPGYVGTFDYFVILAFTAYGADKVQGAALALLIHTFLWVPVTLAGGLAFLVTRRGEATRRGETAEPDLVPSTNYESKLQS